MSATTSAEVRARLIDLLRERSVTHGHFELASGKRSSYYIDARRTTMSGQGQVLIGTLGVAAMRARGWTPRAIGGLTLGADPVAYAIAHAARLAGDSLDAFTVRKEAKTHGTGRRIEGCFEAGDAVVVIEDVITTGRSTLDAIGAVRADGGLVIGALAVVDREEGGLREIEAAGFPVAVLVAVSELGV